MSTAEKPVFYVISDATGQTCERVLRAALSQFEVSNAVVHVRSYVRTTEAVTKAARDAAEAGAMIVYTLVGSEERRRINQVSRDLGITAIDVLGPILEGTESFLGTQSREIPGLYQDLFEDE